MNWNVIETQEDIDKLMNDYGYFHDGCIKELKYISGGYVDENLSMSPINSLRNLSIIFHRQYKNPSAIEMIFEGIQKMNLEPSDGSHDCIIYEASLKKINGFYYWADWDNFKITDLDEIKRTWISASKIKWRVADGYMGKEEVYIARDLQRD